MDKEQTNIEFKSFLNSIIEEKFKRHIDDWLSYAKPNEKKGLFILSKIIKHKGEKMFKNQLKKSQDEDIDVKSLTMVEAYKRYQKKKISSNYTEFYGSNMDEKFKYNNILKFKDFEHLEYAEFIKKENHSYIKNWIKIEQTEQYKEFLLDFLRSFMSTIRSNRSFVTHNSEELKNYNRNNKFTIHAVFGQNKHPPRIVDKPITLDEVRARINELNQNINNSEEANKNNAEAANRKKELISGAKNILKGIYNNTSTTQYQEVYKGQQPKYHIQFKPDFSTSMIKGIIPDPIVGQTIKESYEINEKLKNSVKNIMFS